MSAVRAPAASPLARSLAAELAELEASRALGSVDVSPELVRLGAEQPLCVPAQAMSAVPPPDAAALGAVARIATHLGGVERALAALPEPEAQHLEERLSRARVLVDCASALAELRATVGASLWTARAA